MKSIYFEENRKFIFENEWNPDKWLKENNKAYFIFDEAEQLLEKRLLTITERGLKGLVRMAGKNLAMFSGTLDPFWRNCYKAAFKADDSHIF